MNTAVAPLAQSTDTKSSKPDFGQGRYSPLMQECYDNAQIVLGVSAKAAEKLAHQIGSDFGAAFRNAPVTAKSKMTGKDNKLTLSEASKVKNITGTNALNIMHALNWAGEAGKNGFNYRGTKWKLTVPLMDYIAELEK